MKRAVVLLALVLGTFLLGCAGGGEGPVLAEVGETHIHAAQLRHFEEHLAESLRSKEAGIKGRRQHLQALIDKEILMQEAAARGWDRDRDIRRKLEREWTERLVNEFFAREVNAKVVVEEQEIHDHYQKTGRHRTIIGGKIEVESRAEAEEIVRLLQGGADFGELARQYSTHRPTEERGGRFTGHAATKDQMPEPIMREKVFPLEKGQISEPIPLSDGTYGVFKVVDEVPVPLERVRGLVQAELHREKARRRSIELGRELLKVLNLRPREDGFELLVARLEREGHAFSEAERGTSMTRIRRASSPKRP